MDILQSYHKSLSQHIFQHLLIKRYFTSFLVDQFVLTPTAKWLLYGDLCKPAKEEAVAFQIQGTLPDPECSAPGRKLLRKLIDRVKLREDWILGSRLERIGLLNCRHLLSWWTHCLAQCCDVLRWRLLGHRTSQRTASAFPGPLPPINSLRCRTCDISSRTQTSLTYPRCNCISFAAFVSLLFRSVPCYHCSRLSLLRSC